MRATSPFAGAGLAGDEHRRRLVERGDLAGLVEHLPDGRRLADDAGEAAASLRGPPAVVGELLPELGVLPGAVGEELQLLEVHRLLEVVERAELHRLDRALDGAVGGHDDHGDGGVELADPPQELDAVHARAAARR